MTKEILPNNKIRLTGENGIVDIRTGNLYSEFIGDAKNEKYFADAPVPEESEENNA